MREVEKQKDVKDKKQQGCWEEKMTPVGSRGDVFGFFSVTQQLLSPKMSSNEETRVSKLSLKDTI